MVILALNAINLVLVAKVIYLIIKTPKKLLNMFIISSLLSSTLALLFTLFATAIVFMEDTPSRVRVYMEYGVAGTLLAAIGLEIMFVIVKTLISFIELILMIFKKTSYKDVPVLNMTVVYKKEIDTKTDI